MEAGDLYECPIHKIFHDGQKRENFQTDFYDHLLNVSMETSMKLYKEVNVNCHCPMNYKIFDRIIGSKHS